jgi:hypothetical protein
MLVSSADFQLFHSLVIKFVSLWDVADVVPDQTSSPAAVKIMVVAAPAVVTA